MNKTASSLGFEFSDAVFQQPQPTIDDVDSVANIVRRALDDPVDYPSFRESVFEGDRVAIAIHPDIPKAAQVAAAVVDYLLEAGIGAQQITLVVAKRMHFAAEQFESACGRTIDIQIHDPDDDLSVSYLAANLAGEPIKINKTLFDADVILPVTCFDSTQTMNDLYPEFATTEALRRFKSSKSGPSENAAEVRSANQHLGVFSALNIVGAPGDSIRKAVFGAKESSDVLASRQSADIWEIDPCGDVDLVIATIEEEPSQQSWEQFRRALVAAYDVAPGNAQLLVISHLQHSPDKAMKLVGQLQFEPDEDLVFRKLKTADETTRRLVSILIERQVFLQSDLPSDVVEELGVGPIGSPSELNRLIGHASTGVLLRDAHKCRIKSTL